MWVHGPCGTKGWADAREQPVWVCLAEATAFCSFNKCCIMTELEYQRALDARDARCAFAACPDPHRSLQILCRLWGLVLMPS